MLSFSLLLPPWQRIFPAKYDVPFVKFQLVILPWEVQPDWNLPILSRRNKFSRWLFRIRLGTLTGMGGEMPRTMRFVFPTYRGADPWNIKLILAGLMLLCGSAISLKHPVGGAIICDHGRCQQTQFAAFGTETEALSYDASEIEGFRVEVDPSNSARSRAVANVRGEPIPLTAGFGFDGREVERIVSDGSRFIDGDRTERLTLRYEER